MLAFLRRFGRDRSGVSAIEMAFIAPILGIVFVGASEGWLLLRATSSLRAAVDSGAQVVMGGERDQTKVRTVMMSSWEFKPSSPNATVTRECRCAAAASACSTTCADSSPPQILYRLRATGNHQSPVFARTLAVEQVVRVR